MSDVKFITETVVICPNCKAATNLAEDAETAGKFICDQCNEQHTYDKSTAETIDTEQLGNEFSVYLAPEMIALLEKSLSFMEEHPYMFLDSANEIQRTKDSIEEFKAMLDG